MIRREVLSEAEKWLGTPYRHQAAERGVGCDCLGLIRGVWASVYGTTIPLAAPYAADWAERCGAERLLHAARLYCGPAVPVLHMAPGDLIFFRWRPQFAAKHVGILADADHFIHAYEQAGVVKSALVAGWRRRIAAVHRFPEKTEVC
ncbi:NlpC/P60 family protein [Martelella endophytica]|uniref:Peptidase P60 n=1 Tax=Martelella endophytica TaxID=1486262 RepID=A0A0D5LTY3_MAREN|nr:NlpC/P60 family protein [Martelella endophytica]AJY47227.1 peptidase P60 [Martelella endophytica]